ncbi:thrombospondin-1-like [Saccoglossus kowalevskii]
MFSWSVLLLFEVDGLVRRRRRRFASPPPVNCLVSSWGEWSTCSTTCGPGTQTRQRLTTSPAQDEDSCNYALVESQECNTGVCFNGDFVIGSFQCDNGLKETCCNVDIEKNVSGTHECRQYCMDLLRRDDEHDLNDNDKECARMSCFTLIIASESVQPIVT